MVLFLLFVPTIASALPPLIPAPRKIEAGTGQFTITSATRIAIRSHDDRLAAETIADEIAGATGHRPAIGASGAIMLSRKPDPALGEEGYRLTVTRERVVITAPTGAGVFYGAQTLRQLVVGPEGGGAPTGSAGRGGGIHPPVGSFIPQVTIEDVPAMRWRGVHDDVSRGPVPTLDAMKHTVRTLAEHKLNVYALYMEHVFAYREHPLIAPPEGALTAAEMKDLVAYAQRYHVTILPEQQTFGHLHHLLKHEKYADLAETPHGHVLAPVRDATYDLIRSLYDELVPIFPGPFVHIGGDETWELGEGQTRARVAQVGLGRVYLEHLQKVAQILKPHGKRLLFWGDIAVHHPQLLDVLPKDMIAVVWAYDPRPSYESQIEPFRKAGFDVFVSPGANNWNVMWPDLDAALVNVRNLSRDGKHTGAIGMLNTTWDDDGEALFGMTWPALVFGAACSWQTDCSIEDFMNGYDWAFYRAEGHELAGAIAELSHIHGLLEKVGVDPTDEAFFVSPFSPQGAQLAQKAGPQAHELRLAAERAIATVRSHAPVRAHADTLDLIELAASRLDLFGMKLQYTKEIAGFYADAAKNPHDRSRVLRNLNEIVGINGRIADLRDETACLRDRYAELWRRENRPHWLGNVLVRWDALSADLYAKIVSVKTARFLYLQTGQLPPGP
jgi:hexosaminidase